ncbi:ABC transporter substrate-binding protein [Leisingera sp.]|uniref:ABC transporter substrate-binding protein n=1 Tax=Leisingera sp. TaxID=1879318 RepID=UPI002B277B29|nr:ABC transporter substrate-binding protein [Leisingera sp.]
MLPLAAAVLGQLGVVHAAPVEIASCYGSFSYDTAPARAVTLNQQATEIMLALGLEDRLAGTAYLDDRMPLQWQSAYQRIPVLAEKYPAREVVLASEPDFLFAGFASAFDKSNLGSAAEWQALGIGTYLSDAACSLHHPGDVPLTVQPLLTDIETIGRLFRVEDRAKALLANLSARLEAVADAGSDRDMTAFFYSNGKTSPYTIGCCGSPALLARSAGLSSITEDINGAWAEVGWETVMARNPDVIVLIDATWSSAAEKRAHMEADPVLSQLDAVRNGRFATVSFSNTVLGARFLEGVERLNAELEALD